MLCCTFCENIDSKVSALYLLSVEILLIIAKVVSFALEFLEFGGQSGLFLLKSALNDLRPRQEPLFKTPKRLVLDCDGRLFRQWFINFLIRTAHQIQLP